MIIYIIGAICGSIFTLICQGAIRMYREAIESEREEQIINSNRHKSIDIKL